MASPRDRGRDDDRSDATNAVTSLPAVTSSPWRCDARALSRSAVLPIFLLDSRAAIGQEAAVLDIDRARVARSEVLRAGLKGREQAAIHSCLEPSAVVDNVIAPRRAGHERRHAHRGDARQHAKAGRIDTSAWVSSR